MIYGLDIKIVIVLSKYLCTINSMIFNLRSRFILNPHNTIIIKYILIIYSNLTINNNIILNFLDIRLFIISNILLILNLNLFRLIFTILIACIRTLSSFLLNL